MTQSTKKIPLERALSKMGLASRTQAAALVKEKKVTVNGLYPRNALALVSLEKDHIKILGVEPAKVGLRILLLHKPKKYVTTRSDEQGRPTIFDLVDEPKQGLHAVGRLDQATTGLLILTNDTKLSAWLTDPKNEIPRAYVVTVRGELTATKAQALIGGVQVLGDHLKAESVEILKASGKETHFKIVLKEGKNREIRKMCEEVGHEVTRLKRISFGALELGDLELGKTRELTLAELKAKIPNAPVSLTPKS